jgi:uncharacterized protein YlxP (DUF503 family)
MHVGILQVLLHVPDSQSLKDKRRIVRGLLDRIRAKFEVAASEIEDQDLRQRAVVGFAAVSNSTRHAEEVMSKVLAYIRESPAANVIEHELETY